jgi:hypothetical protein
VKIADDRIGHVAVVRADDRRLAGAPFVLCPFADGAFRPVNEETRHGPLFLGQFVAGQASRHFGLRHQSDGEPSSPHVMAALDIGAHDVERATIPYLRKSRQGPEDGVVGHRVAAEKQAALGGNQSLTDPAALELAIQSLDGGVVDQHAGFGRRRRRFPQRRQRLFAFRGGEAGFAR